MPEDEKPKEEEKEKSEDESKDEKEDKEKSSSVLDTLSKIESIVTKFDTSKLEKAIGDIGDRVKALETLKTVADKAMEKPTDLPLKPQVQASEDIGAKVKVPDTYQSNSQQASIGDSDPQNENKPDKGGLSMQEKAIEKPTPVAKSIDVDKSSTNDSYRPPTFETAAEILKSRGEGGDINAVLKACRETPYEELGHVVGRGIMKGRFGAPTDGEVARW
jgi:hypothetical protein